MLLPETKARYAEWERRVRQEGIEKGRKKEGQEVVLKMLALRFGQLPATAERRVKRASVATLERWAERLLTAKSLDDVFAH